MRSLFDRLVGRLDRRSPTLHQLPSLSADDLRDVREISSLIGMVAAHWSMLERSIDFAIWEFSELHPKIGACLTAQIQSVRQKLVTLETLVDLRGQEQKEDVIKKIRRLQQEAELPSRRRNRVVHNPFYMNPDDKSISIWRLTADRKLIFDDEVLTEKELEDLINDITRLMNRFSGIFPGMKLPQLPLLERLP